LRVLFAVLLLATAPFAAHAATTRCSKLQVETDKWVARTVNRLVKSAHAAYARDAAQESYESVLTETLATIRRCGLSERVDFQERYRNFLDYVETVSLEQRPGHDLGFSVPDAAYFEETRPFVSIPEDLLSQGFLRSVSRYETLGNAKSYLRRLNADRAPSEQLLFFSYKSRHLGTPDNPESFLRLLIIVPSDSKTGSAERWVQFGVPDRAAQAPVRNVSVVSAVPNEDGTFNTYFKDFFRTYNKDGSVGLKGRWELGEGTENCSTCHKSGILPVFPVAGSVSAAEEPEVQAANERFLRYAPPRFGKYLNTKRLGPGLGTSSAAEREQRFGAGFARKAVAEAMTCVACHNYDHLGALNWPMERKIINSFIKGGKMPPGNSLTEAERAELYDKLILEYFSTDDRLPGILKSWLLGTSKENSP
jgi:hypothetical protein